MLESILSACQSASQGACRRAGALHGLCSGSWRWSWRRKLVSGLGVQEGEAEEAGVVGRRKPLAGPLEDGEGHHRCDG